MNWLSRLLGADDGVDQNAVEDLLAWEEEEDALLPNGLTPEDIARFEAAGFVVDLATGRLIPEMEANGYEVNL